MFSKVRLLILPMVASAALWYSTGVRATEDVLVQDDTNLNMEEGAADGYWGGFGGTFYGGLFCGAYPYLPFCLTGIAYPYVDYGFGGWDGGWGGGGWGWGGGGWGGGWGRGGWGRGGRGGWGRGGRGHRR